MPIILFLIAVVSGAVLAGPAQAYVGPGAGLSLLSAFWALIVAVLGALAFLIVLPFRRRLRRARRQSPRPGADERATRGHR